jgi:acetyl esterase
MSKKPTTSWISQLLGREVQLKPRQSPDEIPAARVFWDVENFEHVNKDLPDLAAFHENVVLRTRQGVDLTAEIYVPHGKGPFPTLIYMHGGSWVLWSAAHMRKMTMRMAAQGFVVVNLDYGLAPEHRFPWAVEDTIFAARWTAQNISKYNGIGQNIFLSGDSAGANLAAAAIAALKSKPGTFAIDDPLASVDVTIGGALLLYGIFDFPLLFADPGRNAGSGTIETTWNLAYLGPNFLSIHKNPLVSPIVWPGLDEFPPTYVNCGSRDALLPQSLAMTRALANADVSTTLSVVPDADHAFLMMADTMPSAEEELQRMFKWLVETSKATE